LADLYPIPLRIMAEASAEKLKVFISYSRKDSADFADELVAGLEYGGFAPFLDRHDISAGEEWEARLGDLIEKSDTVVFVVSPEAVKSERCAWEIDKAHACSKRLLPVIHKPVAEADIPQQLRRLQFVRFDTGPGLVRPLTQLAAALRQDLDWIREHTRLGELAARWQARNRPESLLLRGDELDTAKIWAVKRKSDAPEITDAQRALLEASEVAESGRLGKERAQLEDMRRALEATARNQKRIRNMMAVVGVLLVGIIIVLVGWINQAFVKEQMNWYIAMRPYMLTNIRPYVLKPEAERALKPLASFRECDKDCPEMIVLPAGSFSMGSSPTDKGHYSNEVPQHPVTIARPFAVSKFDVTFADWDACVSVDGCAQATDAGYGRGTKPVIYVNWNEAQRYVTWFSKMTGQSYRLLTEAEWEYAARAGSTTAYSWGDDIKRDDTAMANCNGCGSQWDNRQTSPVGSFKPNAFGLYDMAGNVWQWVQDCYHADYSGAPTDGSAWTSGDCSHRVIRGGSWGNDPQSLRAADRVRTSFVVRTSILGFRIGRTLSVDDPSLSGARP
jgi:formylglycine-generating enzyme required for sulfatase activity